MNQQRRILLSLQQHFPAFTCVIAVPVEPAQKVATLASECSELIVVHAARFL
jgi:hypothetical protein